MNYVTLREQSLHRKWYSCLYSTTPLRRYEGPLGLPLLTPYDKRNPQLLINTPYLFLLRLFTPLPRHPLDRSFGLRFITL